MACPQQLSHKEEDELLRLATWLEHRGEEPPLVGRRGRLWGSRLILSSPFHIRPCGEQQPPPQAPRRGVLMGQLENQPCYVPRHLVKKEPSASGLASGGEEGGHVGSCRLCWRPSSTLAAPPPGRGPPRGGRGWAVPRGQSCKPRPTQRRRPRPPVRREHRRTAPTWTHLKEGRCLSAPVPGLGSGVPAFQPRGCPCFSRAVSVQSIQTPTPAPAPSSI